MAARPPTARSEISSAISDDVVSSRPQSTSIPQPPPVSNTPVSQYGYAYSRGTPTPTSRSVISPAPYSTGAPSRAESPTSHTSRTHIPSITAQGFLRPMSSSRLQQQRLGRHSALGRSVYSPGPDEERHDEHTDDGRSLGSSRQGPYASMPRSHRITPSITSYTGSRATDRYEAAQRERQSEPNNQPTEYQKPPPRQAQPPNALRLNESLHVGSIREDILSPRSLRSGLSLGSRHVFEPGHQHLSSAGSTPYPAKGVSNLNNNASGKNYEYFEGNTTFWWGGRLQNSRDRPINVGTGIVIIIPTILFFIFS